jgi:hypothetical protein
MTNTSNPDFNNELKALDELFQSSAQYRNSKNYLELLEFINKFPSLSPFNAFLIHMQNKGVSLVLSARKWKKYNRVVKPDVRPLVILVPFGPVEFVYDIANTFGDEIPPALKNPFFTLGNLDRKVLERTIDNLSKEGIGYEESSMHLSNAGIASSLVNGRFKITVNSTYDINEKYSTLVHEIGHIFCGHLGTASEYWWDDRSHLDQKREEIEAESVAFLVCKRLGLEASSNKYLSSYIKNTSNEKLPEVSLDTILTVTNQIERMGRPGYTPKAKRKR